MCQNKCHGGCGYDCLQDTGKWQSFRREVARAVSPPTKASRTRVMGERLRTSISLMSTLCVCIIRVPPLGIASRALTARFITTCSIWPGSAFTGNRLSPAAKCIFEMFGDQAGQIIEVVRHAPCKPERRFPSCALPKPSPPTSIPPGFLDTGTNPVEDCGDFTRLVFTRFSRV
jgi:hypothetical protein